MVGDVTLDILVFKSLVGLKKKSVDGDGTVTFKVVGHCP
jgi:hypothetical protein